MVRKGMDRYDDKEKRKRRREFREEKDVRFPKREPIRTNKRIENHYIDYEDFED